MFEKKKIVNFFHIFFFSFFFFFLSHPRCDIATSLNNFLGNYVYFVEPRSILFDTRDEKRVPFENIFQVAALTMAKRTRANSQNAGWKLNEKGKTKGGGEDRRWIVFRLKIPRLGTIRNPRFFSFFFFVKRYCCIDFEGKLMKFHFHTVFYFFISLSVLFVPVNRFDFNCFN